MAAVVVAEKPRGIPIAVVVWREQVETKNRPRSLHFRAIGVWQK